jgi:hypothetical protein
VVMHDGPSTEAATLLQQAMSLYGDHAWQGSAHAAPAHG